MDKNDGKSLLNFFLFVLLVGGVFMAVVTKNFIFAVPFVVVMLGYFAYLNVYYDRRKRELDDLREKSDREYKEYFERQNKRKKK